MCRLAPSEGSHLLNNAQSYNGTNQLTGCQTRAAPIGNGNSENTSKHHTWYIILFGQIITLALSCANVASSTLENNYEIKVPTFQTGLVYFLLSFHLVYLFGGYRMKQKGGITCEITEGSASCHGHSDDVHQPPPENSHTHSSNMTTQIQPLHKFPFTNIPLHTPWYTYLLLAILDVEANYLAMLSFQHTSLSSSMLLTSLSVLSTVLLRKVVFRSAKYGRKQLFGVLMCLVGGCLWLWEEFYHGGIAKVDSGLASASLDTLHTVRQSHMDIVYGDLLALSAACLYGLNDVLAEYFVKANNDRVEYLGMLGFFGAMFSFLVQVPLLEKDQVQQLFADITTFDDDGSSSNTMVGTISLFLCFIVMLYSFYVSVTTFLSMYDATILNLSLQTGPLWAVVLSMIQKSAKNNGSLEMPPVMFFMSLTVIMIGMSFYESQAGNEKSKGDLDEIESNLKDNSYESKDII